MRNLSDRLALHMDNRDLEVTMVTGPRAGGRILKEQWDRAPGAP